MSAGPVRTEAAGRMRRFLLRGILATGVALSLGGRPCDAGPREGEAEAHNDRGVELASQGLYPEAVQAFERAIRLDPRFVAAYYNLGRAQSQLKAFSEASRAFGAAVQIRPGYGDAWYRMGLALQEEGRYDVAAKAYQTALSLFPDHPAILYRLGVVFGKLGDWAQAAPHWETLLDRHPGHRVVPWVQEDLPHFYYNLGTSHQKAGRLDEAATAYSRVIDLRPDYIEAHHNLALIYREQERFEAAASAFRRALHFRPESPEILSALGGVYALQDSLDRALEQFQAALRLEEDDADAWYGLANVYIKQGKVEKAQSEALRHLKRFPKARRSYILLAYVYEHNGSGVRYGEGYRHQEAVRVYQDALRLNPDDAGLYYNLGVLYGRQADWPGARTAFHKTLAIDSTHAGARRWLPVVEAQYKVKIKK